MTREFWCFISYRHADNVEVGRQWASWLHRAIETYEVPADLVGTTNARGDVIPQRIFPVFRDEEELPVDADLAAPIYRALDASKFLLVICSPRAVESEYVAKEILYFKQKPDGQKRILAAMIEGEPNVSWDVGKQAAGFRPAQECFPKPLRHPVDAEGRLVENDHAEPIAADFRLKGAAQGWTHLKAYRRALQQSGQVPPKQITTWVEDYGRQCELMKLKIIAGILGVDLGTLTQRDAAYQLALAQKRARTLRRWLLAVGLLMLVAVAAGVVAYRKQIDLRAELANTQLRSAVADIDRNETPRALAELARALRIEPGHLTSASRSFSLLVQRAAPSVVWQRSVPFDVEDWSFQPSIHRLLLLTPEKIVLLDSASFAEVMSFARPAGVTKASLGATGERIALYVETETKDSGDRISYLEVREAAQPEKTHPHFSTVGDMVLNADFSEVVGSDLGGSQRFDTLTGAVLAKSAMSSAAFSADGKAIFAASHDNLMGASLDFRPETVFAHHTTDPQVVGQAGHLVLFELLESSHSGEYAIFDTSDPRHVIYFESQPVKEATFAGDGVIITTAGYFGDRHAYVIPIPNDKGNQPWQANTGAPWRVDSLDSDSNVAVEITDAYQARTAWDMAVSADGNYFCFLDGTQLVTRWLDPNDGIHADKILTQAAPWIKARAMGGSAFLVSAAPASHRTIFAAIDPARPARLQTTLLSAASGDMTFPQHIEVSADGKTLYGNTGLEWDLRPEAPAGPQHVPGWDELSFTGPHDLWLARHEGDGVAIYHLPELTVKLPEPLARVPVAPDDNEVCRFSPGANHLLLASGKKMQAWDVHRGALAWTTSLDDELADEVFIDGGAGLRTLQYVEEVSTIRDWDMATGRVTATYHPGKYADPALFKKGLFVVDQLDGLFVALPSEEVTMRLSGLARSVPNVSEAGWACTTLRGGSLLSFKMREKWDARMGEHTYLRVMDVATRQWLTDWTDSAVFCNSLGETGMVVRKEIADDSSQQLLVQQLLPPGTSPLAPSWWPDLLECVAGGRMDAEGKWNVLPPDETADLRARLRAALTGRDDAWEKLTRQVLDAP